MQLNRSLWRTLVGTVVAYLFSAGCSANDHVQFTRMIREYEKLLSEKRYEAAAFAAERACGFAVREFGAESDELSLAQNDLALALKHLERYPEAESLLVSACRIDSLGNRANTVAFTTQLYNLGQVYALENKFEESEAVFLRALLMRKLLLGDGCLEVADCLAELSSLYIQQSQWNRAKDVALQNLSIRQKRSSSSQPNVGVAYSILLTAYYHLGIKDSAEYYGNQALKVLTSSLGVQHVYSLQAAAELARVHHSRGDLRGADSLYSHVMNVLSSGERVPKLFVSTYIPEYADLLDEMGDSSRAQIVRSFVSHQPGNKGKSP